MITAITSVVVAILGILAGAVVCVQDGKVTKSGWIIYSMILIVAVIAAIAGFRSSTAEDVVRTKILEGVHKDTQANLAIQLAEIEVSGLVETKLALVEKIGSDIEDKERNKGAKVAKSWFKVSMDTVNKSIKKSALYAYDKDRLNRTMSATNMYLSSNILSDDKARLHEALSVWLLKMKNDIRLSGADLLCAKVDEIKRTIPMNEIPAAFTDSEQTDTSCHDRELSPM